MKATPRKTAQRKATAKATGGKTKDAVVRARIDSNVKKKAEAVLKSMGLTSSFVCRMLITRIAKEKALPFEPLVPNAKTVAALKAVREGDTVAFTNVADLMADLDAED